MAKNLRALGIFFGDLQLALRSTGEDARAYIGY